MASGPMADLTARWSVRQLSDALAHGFVQPHHGIHHAGLDGRPLLLRRLVAAVHDVPDPAAFAIGELLPIQRRTKIRLDRGLLCRKRLERRFVLEV